MSKHSSYNFWIRFILLGNAQVLVEMADKRPSDRELYANNDLMLAVSPATQHLLKFINMLLSTIKGKTSKLTSKIALPRHIQLGWQVTVAVMIRSFTKVANHIMENEELNCILQQCSFPSLPMEITCNCASLNDLENLDSDIDPYVYQQWQIAEIHPPRRRSFSHLQHLWKKQAYSSTSRCSTRVGHNFSPPSRCSMDDDDLDDLDCERLSQVSGSAITAVNVFNGQNLVDVQQQLADLQKQLAMVFQLQQQQLQQQQQASQAPKTEGAPATLQSALNTTGRSVAPPPAPPPPPPDFFSKKSSAEPIVRKLSNESISSNSKTEKPSLMDVLKDISNVKLKKVEGCRSPNGTPMRFSSQSSSKSGQFLAEALKEQFRNVRPIESDDDTDTNSNGVWDEDV